ncbi:hypothetical protein [Janibacter massiliensis]|uniref:hypothetical protein n=1 Tax=Janibacter massiliensis TaxID=2058291 RepID=UPI000D10319B|nr:hypothetical protein [Janibacter massiliensis]
MTGYTAGPSFRVALRDVVADLLEVSGADALVTLGPPDGATLPDTIVQIGGVTADQEVATMGPQRSREERLEVEVLFSLAMGGGSEVDDELTARAFDLLGSVEHHLRVVDTTVRGTVRQCFLTRYRSDGAGPDADTSAGRFIDITATFTAHARVTGTTRRSSP